MSSLLRRLGRVRPAWWFVLALALRLAAAAVLPARTLGDVDRDSPTYLGCARSMLDSGTFALDGRPTAMVPPLYPWLLAPVLALGPKAFFPVLRILQSAMMAAVCLFVYGAG